MSSGASLPEDDSVASLFLGLVERSIGPVDELFHRYRRADFGRDTRADRDHGSDGRRVVRDQQILDLPTDAFRERKSAVGGDPRQDDGELLAAVAAGKISALRNVSGARRRFS